MQRKLITEKPLRWTGIFLALVCVIIIAYPAIFRQLGPESHLFSDVRSAEKEILSLHLDINDYWITHRVFLMENEENAKAYFAELGFEICPQTSHPLDPWGNPYQIIIRDSSNETKEVGVYSKGRDGISESTGNDPDDINSWDNTRQWRSHYFP